MPTITNTSVLNQAKRVCKVLKARGENMAAEHTATILVRSILEELGEVALLNGTDAISIETRKSLVTLAKQFCTASKNWQSVYAANTKGDDGEMLMPTAKGNEQRIDAEFV
jgi:hypothetical protein